MPTIKVPLIDIPTATPLRVTSGEIAIALVRSNGQVHAFEDVCPHAFWPLSSGEVENDVLICPGHGWEFSLTTGQCHTASIYCLKSVPMTIEGDTVIIDCDGISPPNFRKRPHTIAIQPAV